MAVVSKERGNTAKVFAEEEKLSSDFLPYGNAFDEEGIFELLRLEAMIPADRFDQAARTLALSHRAQQKKSKKAYSLQNDYILETQKRQLLQGIESFEELSSSFSPLLQIGVGEVRNFIKKSLLQNSKLFDQRAARGFFCSTPFRISLQNVLSPAAPFEPAALSFHMPYSDLLCDLASLEVELEVSGLSRRAKDFSSRYFQLHPELYDSHLYQLALVTEGIARSRAFLQFQNRLKPFDQRKREFHQIGIRFLSYACRTVFNLQTPFLIVISGQNTVDQISLGSMLSELLCAAWIGSQNRGQQEIINRTSVFLGRGLPVILNTGSPTLSLLLDIKRLVEKFKCTPLLVTDQGDFHSGDVGGAIHSLTLSPFINTEEMAFFIVREFQGKKLCISSFAEAHKVN